MGIRTILATVAILLGFGYAAAANAPATVEGYRVGVDASFAKGRVRTVATTSGAYTLQSEMGLPLLGGSVYVKDALSASPDSTGALKGKNTLTGAAFYGPVGVEVSDMTGKPTVTAEGVVANTLVQGTVKPVEGGANLGARVARAETFGPVTLEVAASGARSASGKLSSGVEASGFGVYGWGVPFGGISADPTNLGGSWGGYAGVVLPAFVKGGQVQPMVTFGANGFGGSLGLRYNFQ